MNPFGKRRKPTQVPHKEITQVHQPQELATSLPSQVDFRPGDPPVVSGTETRKIESPEEQRHRHKQEQLKLLNQIAIDWFGRLIFSCLVGLILVTSSSICTSIQNDQKASEDYKKAALAGTLALWTAVVSGGVGYMAGKSKAGSDS
jgi:hypothetical protein